jgi:hypothetical protein
MENRKDVSPGDFFKFATCCKINERSHFLTLPHTSTFFLLLPHTSSYFLTLPHTSSHSLTLPHTRSHFLALPHTSTHFLTLPHTSYILTLPHTSSHPHILTLPHTHTHTSSHSLTLAHTFSHFLTLLHTSSHFLTLSHSSSYFLTLPHTSSYFLTLPHTSSHFLTLRSHFLNTSSHFLILPHTSSHFPALLTLSRASFYCVVHKFVNTLNPQFSLIWMLLKPLNCHDYQGVRRSRSPTNLALPSFPCPCEEGEFGGQKSKSQNLDSKSDPRNIVSAVSGRSDLFNQGSERVWRRSARRPALKVRSRFAP